MAHSGRPVRQKKNNEGQTLTWNKIEEMHYILGDFWNYLQMWLAKIKIEKEIENKEHLNLTLRPVFAGWENYGL